MVKHIDDTNFNSEVLQANGVVVVDFWAEWCGPCKMIAPILDELSDEVTEVKFTKIDVDKNPSVAGQYKIVSIPTLIIFKDGVKQESLVGFRPKDALKAEISKYL